MYKAQVVLALDRQPDADSYTIAKALGCSASLVRYYRQMMFGLKRPGRPRGKPNRKK